MKAFTVFLKFHRVNILSGLEASSLDKSTSSERKDYETNKRKIYLTK